MSWTALVPLKAPGGRKGRLASKLSEKARAELSEHMFAHVAAVLIAHPRISGVALLSALPLESWTGGWIRDEGRGLNPELEAARAVTPGNLLILHADLPRIAAADLDALLEGAGQSGIAIAPDRHGHGTNALALRRDRPLALRFGPDSFRLHYEQAPDATIVRREGLALDVDTPDDLAMAHTYGAVRLSA